MKMHRKHGFSAVIGWVFAMLTIDSCAFMNAYALLKSASRGTAGKGVEGRCRQRCQQQESGKTDQDERALGDVASDVGHVKAHVKPRVA